MADGPPPKSTVPVNHTRTLSLPNPLRLIQMAESPQQSYDDASTDGRGDTARNFLDNLIAIGQAAVEAANLQEEHSDEEYVDHQQVDSESILNEQGSSIQVSGDDQLPDVQISESKVADVSQEHKVLASEPEANYNLVCPVCLENFYRPHKCHPCRHIFCEPCLCRLRKADLNHPTKCPLCREKIRKCVFDSALSTSSASTFPEVYQLRHKQEKKQKHKLPPLPGIPIIVDKYGKNMLATWSAVCAVVLLMMFVFTVFASLVGFVLWYTMEVMLDVVGELLMEASDFLSFSWQALIILYIEGKIPQDIKDILSGSAGRITATMSRLVNRTKAFFTDGEVPPPQVTMYLSYDHDKLNSSTSQILTKVTQVNVANYVFLAGLFTYFLYRVARYFQNDNAQHAAERVQ